MIKAAHATMGMSALISAHAAAVTRMHTRPNLDHKPTRLQLSKTRAIMTGESGAAGAYEVICSNCFSRQREC